MAKNIQWKIILIFFFLGMITIVGTGIFFIYILEQMNPQISGMPIDSTEKLAELVSAQIDQTKIVIVLMLLLFGVITVLVGIFVSKSAIKPITKLIKSTKKIVEEENIKIEDNKNLTEIDELVNAVELMTGKLKQNLTEVKTQKKQIETILLHMTDGIIAFDRDGNITHINPAAKKLLKIEEDQNTFDSIFSKINVEINMEKIIYLDNWTSSEQKVNIDDNYIKLLFAPFKDEFDRPSGVMVMIQDITEHVKLDNMRKEFVADVSHELKTPITSIMGYSDTLLEGEYDKETSDKFLNVIASEARRMARLVTDLLTLSRYDSNKAKYEKTEFDLGELVKRAQERLQVEINKKNHNVTCFVTANVPPVIADKDGIERVVLNILTNAIKYTPDHGEINIYVGFVYNDAYIKVKDNGIGIPEEDLTRIYDRFYRVDKARTRELGGTGLGLSIAKEILDRNEGSIDIKSIVGKGTEVVIRIKAKQNE